jgi:hypothetical protein
MPKLEDTHINYEDEEDYLEQYDEYESFAPGIYPMHIVRGGDENDGYIPDWEIKAIREMNRAKESQVEALLALTKHSHVMEMSSL